MKIAIISDTHSRYQTVEKVLEILRERQVTHVIHCGERSRELLSGLGLDQIFDIQADGTEAPHCEALAQSNGDPAEKSTTAKREQAGTMLEAHEALCQAAPKNLTRFKDVLEYLKQDLQHESPAK